MEVATNLCNSVKRWHLEADTVLVEKNDWSILFFVRTRMLTKAQRVFVRLRVMLSHLQKRFFRKNGGLNEDPQFTKTNTKKNRSRFRQFLPLHKERPKEIILRMISLPGNIVFRYILRVTTRNRHSRHVNIPELLLRMLTWRSTTVRLVSMTVFVVNREPFNYPLAKDDYV
jgi:hypothetical protein